MRTRFKRGGTLLLAAALVLSLLPIARASEALGSELRNQTVQIAQGVSVTNQSLWSATFSDLRTENYITYTPNGTVRPVVSYGARVGALSTMGSMAGRLEEQGQRVVAGINASFFNGSGTTVGLLITEGLIQSAYENFYVIGFFPDGTARIGNPGVTLSASWTTHDTVETDEEGNETVIPGGPWSIPVTGLNQLRGDGNYYLYSDAFGSSTRNTVDGVDVVLRPMEITDPETGAVTRPAGVVLGQATDCEVLSVRGSREDNSIPAGCLVLSMNVNSDEEKLAALSVLQEGDVVTVTAAAQDASWNSVQYAVSGIHLLVKDGAATAAYPTARNPYTAVGVKADGSVVLYTIDGRQSGYSVGATYDQVAKRMIELGCVDVVGMDGGGSTTFGATMPDQSALHVRNKPSDGSARSVSTCIFLVEPANGGSGVLDSYYVSAETDLVLAGASLPLKVSAVDSACYPMQNTAVAMTWEAGQGTVAWEEAGWVYTAPAGGSGFDAVTVSGDGASGSIRLRIIDTLSSITVTKGGDRVNSLTVEPNESVELGARGSFYNLAVQCAQTNWTWSLEGDIGSIDAFGRFTAGPLNSTGVITVTGGGQTASIPVTVAGKSPFVDAPGHWAEDYITELYQMGLTQGELDADGNLRFHPNRGITRGELLTLTIRMLGVEVDEYAQVVLPFEDTAKIADWLLPYVQAAYALEIFNGVEQGGRLYAKVGDQVTREAAMTLIGRTLGYTETADLSEYADVEQISEWAKSYVETLVALGVIQGANGSLSPKASITRGEAAKIIGVVAELPVESENS